MQSQTLVRWKPHLPPTSGEGHCAYVLLLMRSQKKKQKKQPPKTITLLFQILCSWKSRKKYIISDKEMAYFFIRNVPVHIVVASCPYWKPVLYTLSFGPNTQALSILSSKAKQSYSQEDEVLLQKVWREVIYIQTINAALCKSDQVN